MAEERLDSERSGIQIGAARGVSSGGGPAWGYTHALLSAFWSAVMVTLSKYSLAVLDPVSLIALIMSVGAIVVAVWLFVVHGWGYLSTLRGPGWKWSLGLSGLFFFVMYAAFTAIDLMDPTIVAFVSRTETLVAIALGVWLFGERFSRKEAVGALFVIAGILALRYTGGVSVERGFWILIASSVGFGVAEVMAKKTVTMVDPLIFSLFRNVFLGVSFGAFGLIRSEGLVLPVDALGWASVIAIAISGPFLGRVHYLKALQKIHISRTALISQSQPIWVALLALAILHTVPTEREWLAGATVLAGCVLLIQGRARPERRLGPR